MPPTLTDHAHAAAHYSDVLTGLTAEGMLPELCSNAELACRLRAYSLRELDVEIADTLLTAADRLIDAARTTEV